MGNKGSPLSSLSPRAAVHAAPAVVLLAPYACGILLYSNTGSFLPAILACLLLAAAEGAYRLKTKGKRHVFFLLASFLFLGTANAYYRLDHRPPRSVSRLAGLPGHVYVEGRLVRVPLAEKPARFFRTVMEVHRAGRPGNAAPCTGRLYLYVRNPVDSPAAGDRVALTGRILPPPAPRNPGEPDMRFIFRARGIDGSVFTDGTQLRILDRSVFGIRATVWRLRRFLKKRIEACFDPAVAPLVTSLVLGIRDDIADRTRRRFRRSGTLHLLAISGLHVSILAGILYLLLGVLRVRPRFKYLLLAAATIFYTFIAGARVPIVRTAVMALVYFLSRLLFRRTNVHNTLAVAAFLILLADPLQIRMPGFILSFTAILSLLHLVPLFRALFTRPPTPLERVTAEKRPLRTRARKACGKAILISSAAWTGTFPVIIRFFHVLTPWAPVTNVLVVPLVAGVLLCGFTAILVPLPFVLSPIGWTGSLLARILLGCVDALASLPFAVLRVHAFPILYFYTGLGLLAVLFGGKPPRSFTRGAVAVIAFLAGLAAWLSLCTGTPDPRMRVHLADVGHGNFAVVTRGAGTVVVDTGSARRSRSVTAVLNALRVSRIDVLVLSHFDEDHAGNALALLEEFPVGVVVLPPPARGGAKIRETARRRGSKVLDGTAVRHVDAGHDLVVTLFPPPAGEKVSANDASLVCRVSGPGCAVLFTADIEKKGTERLLAHPGGMAADVVVAPHHGHVSPPFRKVVTAARPRIVLISQARRDLRFSTRLVRFLDGEGIPHASTAHRGYIRITCEGKNMSLFTFLR